MKVKIIQNEPCVSKLAFVKLLKECTGLGLKDAKDIADRIWIQGYYVVDIHVDSFIKFKTELKQIGNFSISGDTQWTRESKILTLGIGNKEEYVGFISEFIKDNRNSDEILEFILDKMTKTELKEVISKINEYYNKFETK